MALNVVAISWGELEDAVSVLRQRVVPELSTWPFTTISASKSTFPPTSPLAFSPRNRWPVVRALSVMDADEPAGGTQLPMTFHGLPPLKARLAESWVLAVELIEGRRSAVRVEGLAVPPLPCK